MNIKRYAITAKYEDQICYT